MQFLKSYDRQNFDVACVLNCAETRSWILGRCRKGKNYCWHETHLVNSFVHF